MIFVTVGNATDGFRRLLDGVDGLVRTGLFSSHEMFFQSGHNPTFSPDGCQHQALLSAEEFAARVQCADLIICHGGAGTLLHVLREGKIPVVMPRRRQYGEVIDDHQIELTTALAAEGMVVPAMEPEDLPDAVLKAKQLNTQVRLASFPPMVALVSQALAELTEESGERYRDAA